MKITRILLAMAALGTLSACAHRDHASTSSYGTHTSTTTTGYSK
jgi:type IV pilus biogenesis protein CpaD/CtpE